MPGEAYLRVESISKRYTAGLFERGRRPPVEALREVSFGLERGRILGLVGASGSGKSTLAHCLALGEAPDSGAIFLERENLWACSGKRRAGLRARIQLIAQQPAASLNPRFTAAEIVAEPLVIQRRGTAAQRRQQAARWMDMVGLDPGSLDNHALDFSGGERQRLAIARALILEPSLLILDESFAGLDLSIQAQIARLLRELQKSVGLACILITHDLGLAASLADDIAVMEAGRIVESGPAGQVVAHPRHARTRELLDAAAALSLDGEPHGA